MGIDLGFKFAAISKIQITGSLAGFPSKLKKFVRQIITACLLET